MPFDAVTLGYVEDALAECFNYHQSLDTFVVRSGVSEECLAAARRSAQERVSGHSQFKRAPKRYVAQELLAELARRGEAGDRVISNLITAFARGAFDEATSVGGRATDLLRAQIDADRKVRREETEHKAEELRRREYEEARQREAVRTASETRRQKLRQAFIDLSTQNDPQARGYMFEKFLLELFEFEGLQPRGSFRVVGEQIDGSFIWRGGTHLTEAKWISERVAGAEFGAFAYKIEGKTADTRGLFIAINGYSETAIRGLNGKGALRFVCIDGAHLMRALEPGWSLVRIFEIVWRHADETGQAYLPVMNFPE